MHAMHSREAPRLPVLIALSAIAVLPVNMFVPSLPGITRDLHTDYALANTAVAGYAIATAFTHLVAGALSDRFGRKPVALVALAVFTLASIGCSLANDIVTFLLCRLCQGTVIAGYAVSLAAIRDTSGERGAASRIGYVSSAWAVAPMLGPTAGGLLDSFFGWRANFIAFAVLGVVGLCLVTFCFRETNLHRTRSVALQVKGYGELMRSPRFWAYALCMAFGIGTLYAFLGGAPLVAAQLGGMSGTQLGLCMGLVPAGFIAGSYVVGHAGARHTPAGFILAGRVLTCVGLSVGLVLMACGATHPLAFFGPCVCVGLGNGLTMPAANARVLSIRPGLAGTASGLASALTVIGAGIVAFLSGLVVDAANAHLAVLGVMLASSVLSLLAAVFVLSAENAERRLAA
ncbi:multidrug effflux MFS transporter [Variovorax sp. J22G73]|uniref:multidrug effflux MFS transporter n=1 Tax=unclassified Variovorax TaxID=663243 RepID=UPI0025773387|nr:MULTISPECIES: multidrug effflux MFS transporter [unclassified Variovorax]MDM0005174.1 multidrug effflux MFS transporter [Variovorax sp. J22R203]MDM0098590.1 multidrug effflux MFS transporter [Variovorax sp. J22G73]